MSEAHRSDSAHTPDAAPGADRDAADRDAIDRNAKIEQLLLVGLDHYFGGRYEQAINVWTRALFLDRNHARARAYIERARTALAEGQRESEELLQTGVAAYERGEGEEARRLLQSALERGAPPDAALAVLDKLNRLEAAVMPTSTQRPLRAPSVGVGVVDGGHSKRRAVMAGVAASLIVAAGGLYLAATGRLDWRSALLLQDAPANAAPPPVHEVVLPLPRRGDRALARAQTLASTGRLHDALAALDAVRPTDPERADADKLRATIQSELLSLAETSPPTASDTTKGEHRVP